MRAPGQHFADNRIDVDVEQERRDDTALPDTSGDGEGVGRDAVKAHSGGAPSMEVLEEGDDLDRHTVGGEQHPQRVAVDRVVGFAQVNEAAVNGPLPRSSEVRELAKREDVISARAARAEGSLVLSELMEDGLADTVQEQKGVALASSTKQVDAPQVTALSFVAAWFVHNLINQQQQQITA